MFFNNPQVTRSSFCKISYSTDGLAHRDLDALRRFNHINCINGKLYYSNILGTTGYIDLLNGPQDHGWCFGYTCQERISTFYSIVATGLLYELAMTSTPPAGLRLHLITDHENEVKIKYTTSFLLLIALFELNGFLFSS